MAAEVAQEVAQKDADLLLLNVLMMEMEVQAKTMAPRADGDA